MPTSLAAVSLADQIADFVERQYVSEEGDVRGNVESLLAEDLAYHANGETLGREDLVTMGFAVRATRRQGRTVCLSDSKEDGSTVRWQLSANLSAMGADGTDGPQPRGVVGKPGTQPVVMTNCARSVRSRSALGGSCAFDEDVARSLVR